MKRGFDFLAFTLDDVPAGELANSLHRQMREAVVAGRFTPGSRMPATRMLAGELGISRNTVVEVYQRLVDEGYFAARHGSGTFVSEALAQDAAHRARQQVHASAGITATAIAKRGNVGVLPFTLASERCPANFRPGVPDLREFPATEWRRSATRRLRTALPRFFEGDQTQGDPLLRQHLANYLRSSRGVRCVAESILVTAGAQQAFDMLARVLVTKGTVVAVEEPGYPAAVAVFEAAGARIVTVPVDREGLVVSALPPSASLIYVTPSHQFPLGVTMSLQRRKALLQWAAAANAWIVEDDYDSEYRFSGRRVQALQALDTRDRVIYVGTFSKVLLPALRMGYIAMPQSLIEELLAIKWLTDRHTPSLAQAVMAEFMDTGAFARHLRRMQGIYRERFELLRAALGTLPKTVAYLVPAQAGLHMTLLLHGSIDVPRLISDANAKGIGLHALAPFCREPFAQGLVLGYGNIAAHEAERGARWLRQRLMAAPTSGAPHEKWSRT
ncbi:PLP-dependent aminotransferase family protein [Variovorax sp. H27-G14]|uniref:MocR-like pyridoxine biosynthesis transcription factor PdxR n=1 Tax=Variovorax sp. H27-G14 TaxID=3111914 RepID=UPI0038FD305E